MSSTYVPSNTLHGSYVLPSDGDPAVSESVDTALRALADTALYINTQLGHQAADDRGITSTITGAIIWNDGGGSFTVQIDTQLNNVDVVGLLHIHDEGGLQVNSVATFMSSANFAGDVEMSTSSTLTVRGVTEFHNDTQLGFGADDEIRVEGTLTVTGDAVFSNDVQLGTSAADQTTVGGPLVANDTVTIAGTLTTQGSSSLGNAASDTHEITGDLTLNDGLSVAENTALAGDLAVTGNSDLTGTLTVHGEIQLRDDVTLGGASSDEITVNAHVTSQMVFSGSGRPIQQTGVIDTATATIHPTDSREIRAIVPSSGTQTITIDDAGMVNGDKFWFYVARPSGGTFVLNNNFDTASVTITTGLLWVVVAVRISGWGWNVSAWQG